MGIHLQILTDYVSSCFKKVPMMNRLLVLCASLLVVLVHVNGFSFSGFGGFGGTGNRPTSVGNSHIVKDCTDACRINDKITAESCNKKLGWPASANSDCTKCKGCKNDYAWKPPVVDNTSDTSTKDKDITWGFGSKAGTGGFSSSFGKK